MPLEPTQTAAWRASLRIALLMLVLGSALAGALALGTWEGSADLSPTHSGPEPAPSRGSPIRPAILTLLLSVGAAALALWVGWRQGRASARLATALADAIAGVDRELDPAASSALLLPTPAIDTEDELAGLAEDQATGEVALILQATRKALDTAGRRLDEYTRQSREQQTILEAMRSGLLALDPEQRVIRVNRAAADMLGVDGERVRGRLVQAVTRQPGLNRFLSDALAGDAATEGEFVVDREGRPRIVVHAVSEPLRDGTGRPTGLLVSLSDVTTLRRLESLRADFAANVSHELRTPITNIKGYADTLLQVGVGDPAQTARFLEVIRRNAHRLGAIIEDLLALARLEQPVEREELEAVDVPIRELVQTVREDLEIAAQAKSMAIVDATPEGLRTRVVPSLAQQALANLVSNAITYSPAGGEVRITASTLADGMVEVAVTDHGQGIAPHHLGRIFERFYRIDRARSRDQGGTGLGLAIVKHIALLHGGRVEVESRLGAGSTFKLILPGRDVGQAQMAG
jgi:two-component system phosphate regulon sensor histidine kinase PhoR